MMAVGMNNKFGLVGLLMLVMMAIAIWQGRTAVAANGNSTLYLPLVYKNVDGSLPTPLFGVQVYSGTSSGTAYHSYLLDTTASWVRVPISWNVTEPYNITPAIYNWGSTDSRLGIARNDMGGLNMVATFEHAPNWVSSESNGPIPPQFLGDFVEYVGTAVERYDGDGLNDAPGSPIVLYWEFYNEPDNNSDIQGNPNYAEPTHWGDHAAEYATMLASVYPAVKAANPEAKVVFGGLALDWFEDEGGPFVESFLEDVLQAGGGNYFDVMNFHSYPPFHQNWTDNQGPGILGKAEAIREILADYGLEKRMIVTEAGWMSNNRPGAAIPGSPAAQSRYVVEMFTESRAAELDVMVWWLLVDPPFPYPFQNGLITNEAVPAKKMSFYVYQNVVEKLSKVHFVRSLTTSEMGNPLMEVHEFNDKIFNRALYVAWLNPIATTATAPLKLTAPDAIVTNSLTNFALFVQDSDDGLVDGQITVQVGATPVYVEIEK
jgi:hypothetical protein